MAEISNITANGLQMPQYITEEQSYLYICVDEKHLATSSEIIWNFLEKDVPVDPRYLGFKIF